MIKYSNKFDEALWGEENSIHAKLIEPRFAVKDFDVQPQYINHWRKQGLFFEGGETKGRKIYSFVDFIWIRMIEKMKDIGLRFEVIRNVRENLQAKPMKLELTNENFDKIIANAKIAGASKEQLKKLEIKKKTAFQLGSLQTYFSNYLIGAVVHRNALSFLINSEGEVLHLIDENFKKLHENKKFIKSFQGFYISISVTEIIQEFIEGKKRQIATEKLDIISAEEETVLQQLEKGELLKLIVEIEGVLKDLFNDKPTKEEERTAAVKREYLDIITSKQYEQITFENKRGTETKFLNPNQIELLHGELSEN